MRYFIELAYNGKNYHGWQYQPNAQTVQEVMEHALSTLLQYKIEIVGAGRTDTGVHASKMVAHFDITKPIEPTEFCSKLNAFLPKDIAVFKIYLVTPRAHARFDAISRTYHYRILQSKDVFNYDFGYYFTKSLDIEALQKACHILMLYNNFQCFSKSHTDVKTYNCAIKQATWVVENSHLVFKITADRFLRNMVRAIVGTMINIGLGKINADALHDIIRSKSRSMAGFSAPAEGLFLVDIVYPESVQLK